MTVPFNEGPEARCASGKEPTSHCEGMGDQQPTLGMLEPVEAVRHKNLSARVMKSLKFAVARESVSSNDRRVKDMGILGILKRQ